MERRVEQLEKWQSRVAIGLRIATELCALGERAHVPLLSGACGVASTILSALNDANGLIADALEMGERVVEVLELLQRMEENVQRIDDDTDERTALVTL